jgi:molybdate transport system regulatory protein
MDSEKADKYSGIHLHYKFWMTSREGEYVISDKRIKLLIAINELGSLRAAAEARGISYRKAWGDLKETEKLLGFTLIDKHRGGKEGGRTFLTDDGKILIEAYRVFCHEFQEKVEEVIIKFKRTLKQLDELNPA